MDKRKGKSFTVNDKIYIIAKKVFDLALQVGCPH
jgi:hypothetical protein